jgi:hypothetical protein
MSQPHPTDHRDVTPSAAACPRRRAESALTLPKMDTGAVCVQWVRCGKPRCRCVDGALHGPYHYRFWREAGRLRKRYVPAAEAAVTRNACQARRAREAGARRALAAAHQTWRTLTAMLREVSRDR